MPDPVLFSPITVGGLTIRNRIVIAPMCQYSAEEWLHEQLARDALRHARAIRGRRSHHRGDGG